MPRKKATPKVKTTIVEPEMIKIKPFDFVGSDDLKVLGEKNFLEISILVKKFQGRYGVKLFYVDKFKAFKLKRGPKHVDWITLNDLMKRYDCRIPPVSTRAFPQRPFKNDRVY